MEIILSDEQINIVWGALSHPPVFANEFMSTYKIGSEIMFNNLNLSQVTVNTFVTISGGEIFYETVRADRNVFDVDRRLMSIDMLAASGAYVQTVPRKDFPEHHNPQPYHFS